MTAEQPARHVLGSYVIERELGRGGMGVVYLARNPLNARVAIKVLLPDHAQRDDLRERFFFEARTVGMLEHPSIVKVFDYGVTDDDRTYIVMEYLGGESLGARLKARGLLPIPQAVTIARQIATALAAAHAAGVVHRDLKPDNIFLVPDPEVGDGERAKLLDFGVAKLVADESSQSKTVTGAILGTPQYMSPEQCEGSRVVDQRSDLYSLGCVLFQMVAGRLPFESAGVGGIIGMHLHVPPPKLRDRAPHASRALETIVARLLAKDPAERFQTGGELAAALAEPDASEVDPAASAPLPQQRVDAAEPTAVSRSDRPSLEHAPTLPVPAKRKRRPYWPLVVGPAVLLGVLALVITTRERQDSAGNTGGAPGPDAALRGPAEVDAMPADADPAKAEALLESLVEKLAEEKWIEAGLIAKSIEAITTEDSPTRTAMERVMEKSGLDAKRVIERQVAIHVRAGRCDDAATLADSFRTGWGEAFADDAISRAARCVKRAASEADVDHGAEIFAAHAERDYKRAMDLCTQELPALKQFVEFCVLSACALKNMDAAKRWARSLPKSSQTIVRGACADLHGATVD